MQQKLENSKEITKERVPFIKAVLRRGIISGDGIIKWCDETIEELLKERV